MRPQSERRGGVGGIRGHTQFAKKIQSPERKRRAKGSATAARFGTAVSSKALGISA